MIDRTRAERIADRDITLMVEELRTEQEAQDVGSLPQWAQKRLHDLGNEAKKWRKLYRELQGKKRP